MDIVTIVLLGASSFAGIAALWSVVTSTAHHTTDDEKLDALKQDSTLAPVALRHSWD